MQEFSYKTSGRTTRTIIVLVLVYSALAALLVVFDAAWWLVGGLVIFTLPALWDIAIDRPSSLKLNDQSLGWSSGNVTQELPLEQIVKARFDTRLDFSVRVTLFLSSGKKLRLPYDCLPPHKTLERAMKERGVVTERHHFSLL
ncbi:hypothetical protein ACFFUT_00545 [Pseudohalocynthiibacter aestuariivivens]|jgi:hypothetical protein|uniref:Uncharacterized protein n=1 Tax=Pseudohalocynthiibacter aestuariivivens TaxID=1591409 RepID=A0ABV5J9Z1_9RHOB|nr:MULTISPECIES: hypothetical protein [Pseudohalocynthiibacter]MBS9716851.1 hypothetical protein [Pseudohalocynthiibacter aestuariivivens]MCK0102056.1 hypothetical protein [Pseudohalocynthiibacter sp. F2068]